jgi:hypothetical protein
MAQVLPLNSDGSRQISVDLGDGIGLISFRTRFNSTVPGWYLDLFDTDGSEIVFGLGLVAPHNIIRHLPRLVNRIGDLRVIDLDGLGNVDPDRLGVGVGLVHYPPGEFEELYPDFDNPPLRPLGLNMDDLFSESPP